MAVGYYYKQASELNRELKQWIPSARLKQLHQKRPIRHFAVALRQLLLMVLLPVLIFFSQQPLLWVPAMLLQGVVIFSFTVLLHEVVHKAVFRQDHKRAYRFLGLLYGTLSGLASSQFHRWHMDHHNELGTSDKDPKRAYLSPKRRARWYKLLYCTPALFPIYFAAARKAASQYPPEIQTQIKRERLLAIGYHLAVLAGLTYFGSPLFALKAWAIPVFFVFPIAFTLNRLGQHYVIQPDKIAGWSTLMRPNPIWNFLYLSSSYHLEHHYFPAVPFYNLKALQKELDPFFDAHQIRAYSYTALLKIWFIDNHQPHTQPQEAHA